MFSFRNHSIMPAPNRFFSAIATYGANQPMCRLATIKLAFMFFLIATGTVQAGWQFATPVNLGTNVNTIWQDATPSISSDNLSLYFFSDRPGGSGDWDLWQTSRASLAAPWGSAVNLGAPLNTSVNEASPSISADGLSIYFGRGSSSRDIWVASRPTVGALWGSPNSIAAINSSFLDTDPDISSDGLSLFFGSDRPGGGGRDIYVSTRSSTSDSWGIPANLGPAINGPSLDDSASISDDGLSLFFMSDRDDPGSSFDLYVSERASLNSAWNSATKIDISLPASITDSAPDISFNGDTLYFSSTRFGGSGSTDLWASNRIPEPGTATIALLAALCVFTKRRIR